METNAPKAVFLSYASQDAEAARRIAEALRPAGIEVWFDQEGGLEHGDEWDAKIRHQIKECVLFIPLISANTQARLEGYFRIEWELATERAMGIAHGVPFILPVVIDDTREPEALVPERFHKVQWMRLPDGVVAPEVKARFLKLWSHRTGTLAHQAAGASRSVQTPLLSLDSAALSKLGAKTYALVAVAILAIVATVGWWLLSGPRTAHVSAVAAPAKNVATRLTAPPSEARQLADKARVIYCMFDYSPDELDLAAGFALRATALEETSAYAWAVRAYTEVTYIFRGWDRSRKRFDDARSFANRALGLRPDEPEALLALGLVLSEQGADRAEVEKLYQRAVAAAPGDVQPLNVLGHFLTLSKARREEGLALLKAAVRLNPRDPRAHYNLAIHYAATKEFSLALEHVEAMLALQPFTGALLLKAGLALQWKGDLAAMRAALEPIGPAYRSEDRAMYLSMWCGLMERKPERVFDAAAFGTHDYLTSNTFNGPKAWLLAMAQHLAGRGNRARLQWQAAEALLRQRLRDEPANTTYQWQLAYTLVWLGERTEAAQLVAPIESAWRERLNLNTARTLAWYYAALGDASKAAPCLQYVLDSNEGQGLFTRLSVNVLKLDPFWDKLRGQPEFEALLNDPKNNAPLF